MEKSKKIFGIFSIFPLVLNIMDTSAEESNLAAIGSDEDHAFRKAAAEMEVDWEGAGSKIGIEIWRVENQRAINETPADFGINRWPESLYGQFFNGDSYIVLQTRKDEENDTFIYDIYFWIGKNSSQDEYGVAAYKTVELDNLLGDAPIEHREVQNEESGPFLACFDGKIQYLEGGVESGFRHVEVDEGGSLVSVNPRLFLIKKQGKVTKIIEITLEGDECSLNHQDAFVLDCHDLVYTWFGDTCSPFERSSGGTFAHNLVDSRHGHTEFIEAVDGSNDSFWGVIGCTLEDVPDERIYHFDIENDLEIQKTKFHVLSEQDSFIKLEEKSAALESLISDDICLVDIGKTIFVWVGKESSLREQSQAMIIAQKQINIMNRGTSTGIVKLLEGQESRVDGFLDAF